MFRIAFGLVQYWTSPKVIPFSGITFGQYLPPLLSSPLSSPLRSPLRALLPSGGKGALVLQRAQTKRPGGDLAESAKIHAIRPRHLASTKTGTVPESTRQLRTDRVAVEEVL